MITNYQADNIMNLLFGKTEYVVPDTLYIGLSTSAILEDGSGAVEPEGNGYSRVAVENNKDSFSEAKIGVVKNNYKIVFNESIDDWGVITHIFVADAETNGNILYYDALTKERIVQGDTVLTFPETAITFTLKNAATV